MAYKKFALGIDLLGNDIKNFALENLTEVPAEYLSTGRVWFDPQSKQVKVYTGIDSGVIVIGSSETDVSQAAAADKANQLIVSGGADRSIKIYDTAGLVKINAEGTVEAAVEGVDYVTAGSETVFTNKTIVADDGTEEGTGNIISGLSLANFAEGAVADNLVSAEAGQIADAITIKAYIDDVASSLGALVGAHDASEGLLPANGSGAEGVIVKGDYWRISAEGIVNGLGKLEIGDVLVANANDASGASDYFVLEGNLTDAVTSAAEGNVSGELARFTDASGKEIEGTGIKVEDDGSLNLPEGASYKINGENILTGVASMFNAIFDENAWTGDNAPYTQVFDAEAHGLDVSKSLLVTVRDDAGDEVYVGNRVDKTTGDVEIMSNVKFEGEVLLAGMLVLPDTSEEDDGGGD